MPVVTFHVLEGIDKGRIFRELPTSPPISIGREEGNVLRLNDERVSRFHAKVQFDNGEIILTDLESTNGTRVNGNVVQIRRLRPGDRISIGRSLLLFGSEQEISARNALLSSVGMPAAGEIASGGLPATIQAQTLAAQFDHDLDLALNPLDKITQEAGSLFLGRRPLPPLPQKMTPSQAAHLAELLDFLHRHLTLATENIRANEDGSCVTLRFGDWQRVLAVQMVLARYVRAVTEPETLDD
ncbi:MAG TPA: FHA domain-containing protein [Gemmataceae bacterium]|jgi:predicted component of type VI protein secretion system